MIFPQIKSNKKYNINKNFNEKQRCNLTINVIIKMMIIIIFDASIGVKLLIKIYFYNVYHYISYIQAIYTCALFAVCLAGDLDKDATILQQEQEVNYDGTYKWRFETSNGIFGEESGIGGQAAQGQARW